MPFNSKSQRRGFTLIELLTVISIIALMSGMFLVAYRGAAQESNIQKTRWTIQKISEVLNARMDEYASYPMALRLPNGSPLPADLVSWNANVDTTAVLRERARLLALRDIIRMEMPDHPDDIKYTTFWQAGQTGAVFNTFLELNLPGSFPTGLGPTLVASNPGHVIKNALTSRTKSIMTKLSMIDPANSFRVPLTSPALPENGTPWDKSNANAELLFIIVEGSDLNGSHATELFGKSEVGDTDNDGLNEFIDAFGIPIRWIRWPAGAEGATRYYPDMLDPAIVSGTTLLINSEPYDRLGSDPGWRTTTPPGVGLSPLVVSGGPDEKFGIRFRELDRYSPPATPPVPVGPWQGRPSYSCAEAPFSGSSYGLGIFTDPWYPRRATVSGVRLGEAVSGAASDLENGEAVNGNNSDDNISNFDGTGVSI